MKGVYQMEQSMNNTDVGRCKNYECAKHISDSCYRIISQSSEYDFAKICNEENSYKWFIKNKSAESVDNNT
jgi:hypothetical protein